MTYSLFDHPLTQKTRRVIRRVVVTCAVMLAVTCVATLSVGLALIVRIREAYGTIEADEVREIDMQTAIAQEAEQEAAEKEALA